MEKFESITQPHTNHNLELQECKHLPLPLSVKKDIQQQFASGKSIEHIMDGHASIAIAYMLCIQSCDCLKMAVYYLDLTYMYILQILEVIS